MLQNCLLKTSNCYHDIRSASWRLRSSAIQLFVQHPQGNKGWHKSCLLQALFGGNLPKNYFHKGRVIQKAFDIMTSSWHTKSGTSIAGIIFMVVIYKNILGLHEGKYQLSIVLDRWRIYQTNESFKLVMTKFDSIYYIQCILRSPHCSCTRHVRSHECRKYLC